MYKIVIIVIAVKDNSDIKGIVINPKSSSCFVVHETPFTQGAMLSGRIL